MKNLIRVAMLFFASVVLAGGFVVPAATAASPKAVLATTGFDGNTCAPLLFVGARGSGQKADEAGGYGREVKSVLDGFRAQVPNPDVNIYSIPLDYPALAVGRLIDDVRYRITKDGYASYMGGVNTGINLLKLGLDYSLKHCKDQKWVLSGYSQGALVVHAALSQYPEAVLNDRLSSAILIEDPARGMDPNLLRFGPAPATSSGVVPTAASLGLDPGVDVKLLPQHAAMRTIDVCDLRDLVCDTNDVMKAATAAGSQWLFALVASPVAGLLTAEAVDAVKKGLATHTGLDTNWLSTFGLISARSAAPDAGIGRTELSLTVKQSQTGSVPLPTGLPAMGANPWWWSSYGSGCYATTTDRLYVRCFSAGSYDLDISYAQSWTYPPIPVRVHVTVDPQPLPGQLEACGSLNLALCGVVTVPSESIFSEPISLEGIVVEAYSASSGGLVSATQTTAGGVYRFDTLSAGTYKLRFVPSGGQPGFAPQWFNQQSTYSQATPVVVKAGVAPVASMELIRGGQISGRVTDLQGTVVPNDAVTLYNASSGARIDARNTDSNGYFSFQGLTDGSFKIRADQRSPNLAQWYSGAATINEATAIPVTAGKSISLIDLKLPPGGTISGRVLHGTGGAAKVGVTATQVDQADPANSGQYSTTSGSDGTYALAGLPTGAYHLQFTPDQQSSVENLWYPGVANVKDAGTITLVAGQMTSTSDVVLPEGATITGRITLPDGSIAAIPGDVTAYWADSGQIARWGTTNLDGTYQIRGLAPGSYKLLLDGGYSINGTRFLPQWFDNAYSKETATVVTVSQANQSKNINFTSVISAVIRGTVRSPSGAALDRIGVTLYAPDGTTRITGATTDSTGSFSISRQVPPGTYKVRFADPSGKYLDQWLGGAASGATSQTIVVAPASTVELNPQMDRLAGKISGRVESIDGGGIPGAEVMLYTSDGNFVGETYSGGDGAFMFNGLEAGSYSFHVLHSSRKYVILDENIVVADGQQIVNHILTMKSTGTSSVSGRATDTSGTPLADVPVTLTLVTSGEPNYWTTTGQSGTYSFQNVRPGDYTVQFGAWGTNNSFQSSANNNQYSPQWSPFKNARQEAQPITVDGANAVPNVDARLALGQPLSGHVTGIGGLRLEDIGVNVYAWSQSTGRELAVSTKTDADGAYSVQGLPPGKYWVWFADWKQPTPRGYADVWQNGESYLGNSPITMAPGQAVPNVDVQLKFAGSVSGSVIENNGAPAASKYVILQSGNYRLGIWTDQNGHFSAILLPSGSWTVDYYGGYVSGGNATQAQSLGRQSFSINPAKETALPTFRLSGADGPVTPTPTGTPTPTPIPTGTPTPTPIPTFADVPAGASFHDEITWLGSTGISTGWTEPDGSHTYRPVTPVNRDAMAAFLYRLAGSPAFTPPAVSPFTDVATDNPFYKQITWLADKGISTGYPGPNNTKTFQPLSLVNRDAMAAFLYRFAGSPAYTPPASSPFTDVATNNTFYKQITWLANTKITTGWTEPNGTLTFRPVSAVNRDAMAAFMYRYQKMNGKQ